MVLVIDVDSVPAHQVKQSVLGAREPQPITEGSVGYHARVAVVIKGKGITGCSEGIEGGCRAGSSGGICGRSEGHQQDASEDHDDADNHHDLNKREAFTGSM